jgi:carbon-monoxide dehydrogenase medium subunit
VTPFAWHEPATLRDAVRMLDPDDPAMRPVAGGTALMLMMKSGVFAPTALVSLARIGPRYSEIAVDSSGTLRIGAMASLAALERSQPAVSAFPVFRDALRTLSNIRVRNVARVGGALAHGDPHMDLPPLLASLDARAVIVGPGGTRELAVADLYAGYYETHLARNELIAEVLVPPLGKRKAAFVKVTSRSADDWPALSLAVNISAAGNSIRDARVILSAATDKVTRLENTERLLAGANASGDLFRRAGETAVSEVSLLSDAHGSAAYKRELLRVYMARALRKALA